MSYKKAVYQKRAGLTTFLLLRFYCNIEAVEATTLFFKGGCSEPKLYKLNWCSNIPTKGVIINRYIKNHTVANCPIKIYGCSTGSCPIQVSKKQSPIKVQKKNSWTGRKTALRDGEVCKKGNKNKEINTKPIAATPANLFGMLRKIA